jgi:hypothetical protein
LKLYGLKPRFWLFLRRRRFRERDSFSAFGAIDGEVPFVFLNLICHDEGPYAADVFVSLSRDVGSRAGLASHQRFASRLGTFTNFLLAFNSARFLISALIFSIKVIACGVRILRVEFTCAPSQKAWRSAG